MHATSLVWSNCSLVWAMDDGLINHNALRVLLVHANHLCKALLCLSLSQVIKLSDLNLSYLITLY